jgi:outer membrane immunogenic protein
MKTCLLALAISLTAASTALAADAIVEEVAIVDVAPEWNWSGVYVGAQAGYGFSGNADYIYEDDPDSSYNYQHDVDGALAGAYLGYNYQFGNGVVLGAELDAAWTDIDGSGATADSGDYSSRTEIDWTAAARLRLGYAFDRFLPYISGGAAFAGVHFDEFNDGDFYSGEDFTAVGWTLGAGAEWAVTDNWVLRGEYRFTKFDGKDFTTQPQDENYELDDLDLHDVRIGVAYKF